jgi:16S rRNA (adenine1518-N6/adenine1519-N6)-dimethyltransferase
VDQNALDRVVAAADISSEDFVVEVGPGLGSLTRLLAVQAQVVLAIELDDRLLQPLEEVLAGYDNVRIVHGDILTVNLSNLINAPGYLVVANIPYNITSALIRRLLEEENRPRRLVLTVQREVAERIVAGPGEMSLLALSVQVYGDPEIVAQIPAGAFYPRPRVASSVVRLDLSVQPKLPPHQLKAFFRLAKAGFSQRRKTLRNALSGGMGWQKDRAESLLREAGIDSMRRAQTLSLEEWGKLARGVEKPG